RFKCDWSSDVCASDLPAEFLEGGPHPPPDAGRPRGTRPAWPRPPDHPVLEGRVAGGPGRESGRRLEHHPFARPRGGSRTGGGREIGSASWTDRERTGT